MSRRYKNMAGITPLFLPESNWKAPIHYPDLSDAKEICLDVETFDPHLDSRGPGAVRGDGFLVGCAVAVDGWNAYYPLRHADGNVPLEPFLDWIRGTVKNPEQPKISARGIYDREWLWSEGVATAGVWHDVQIAEALLDEEQDRYDLDFLGRKYTGQGKDETLLEEVASAFGHTNPKENLHLIPARFVGPYAEQDPKVTLSVYHQQVPLLKAQNLWDIWMLESKLTEVFFKMRLQGVRIDPVKAAALAVAYRKMEDQTYLETKAKYFPRTQVSFSSGQDLERVCLQHGFRYNKTDAGNASFNKEFFGQEANLTNDFFKGVARWRKINKLRKDFLDGMCSMAVRDRIHAEFVQIKREDSGTRSGRVSCKLPNLQQIPSRDKEFAPEIRACYLPNPGEFWVKLDYSQQEYRILVHYAGLKKLPGAEEATKFYIDDINADYHAIVASLTGLERGDAKNVNFATAYGAGVAKFASMVGISIQAAKDLMEKYHTNVPYVKQLSRLCADRAGRRGWIKTLGGRVLHFEFWEPNTKWEDRDELVVPERLTRAQGKWPNIALRRAGTHKTMNRLIQGSAADMTKTAMLRVYEQLGKVPLMQVHDELSYSCPTMDEAFAIKKIMENCMKIRVPILADLAVGPSWGETKKEKK